MLAAELLTCRALGQEDTRAVQGQSLLPLAVPDEQLRKCLEWHFPAWHLTQPGSTTGCKSPSRR